MTSWTVIRCYAGLAASDPSHTKGVGSTRLLGGGAGQRVGGGGNLGGGSYESIEEKLGIPFGGLGAWGAPRKI